MLTFEIARQLALMLKSGMPLQHAMVYFMPDATEGERNSVAAGWTRSKLLQQAVREIEGDDWQNLSLEVRIQNAIDKHYSELAYFLYTHNYTDVAGLDKTKSDTARSVLETKLAGLAGKASPLEAFWNDLRQGKAKLSAVPQTLPA